MVHVTVLYAKLADGQPSPRSTALLERLPYAWRLTLERRVPAAREASLAGLSLVLEGIARLRGERVSPSDLIFPVDGKPCLEGGPYFSVSHGRTHVAVALCEECEVGFDLEEVDVTAADADESLGRLAQWTATEAVLKAAGRGLREAKSVKLDAGLTVGRIPPADFQLRFVRLAPHVVACLATARTVDSTKVEEVAL
jgi:phosphopantetheinyl transferase